VKAKLIIYMYATQVYYFLYAFREVV